MIEEDELTSDICCPLADRILDVRTADGYAVNDLHRHLGLFRGIVLEGERRRTMFWYAPKGNLTRAKATGQDLRKIR